MTPSAAPAAGFRMFRSLSVRNYRNYFWGGLIANIGTWMQRTAQAWVVLQLTGGVGAALGVVTFLQFGPTLFLSVLAGILSDRFAKHKILIVTQSLAGLMSLIMGVLDLTGVLTLGHVYLLAACTGIVFAFDVPARQAFASELVGRDNIVNAIGLNSASFNVARLLGPPLAGLVIASFTTWGSFFIHAASAVAIVVSLARIDVAQLKQEDGGRQERGRLMAGFSFLRGEPVIVMLIVVASLIAAVGANSLQVVIPLIATEEFGSNALGFGFLTSALAVGGLIGALLASTSSGLPRYSWLFGAAVLLGVSQVVASLMPSLVSFGAVLVSVGLMFMSFVVLVNTRVQLSAPIAVRGRVIAVYMMFFMGGGALGAPVLGVLADWLGSMETITVTGTFGAVVGVVCGSVVWLLRRSARRRSLPTVTSETELRKLEHAPYTEETSSVSS